MVAVIDGTLHTTAKPNSCQHLWYKGHYSRHGIVMHLLIWFFFECLFLLTKCTQVDFDGYIIAFLTNIPGSMHDALICTYNTFLHRILGNKFALADSAFGGIRNIVAGFRPCHVISEGKRKFDRITRRDQVMIENVHRWIKASKSISKGSRFVHGEPKLVYLHCMRLSNMRRLNGDFR